MKRKSQFLALFLALCLLAGLAVIPAAADEDSAGSSVEEGQGTDTPDVSDPGDDDKLSEEEEEKKKQEEEEKKKQEEEEKKKQEEEEKKKQEEEEKKKQELKEKLTPSAGALSFSVSGIEFESVDRNGSAKTKAFTITNNGNSTMYLSWSVPSGFKMGARPDTLEPGETSDAISIRLSSTETAGTYGGNIRVDGHYVSDGVSGNERSFSINVSAKVNEIDETYSIVAEPSSKDFGKLKEGYSEEDAKELEATVYIRNKSTASILMDRVTGNDHFTVAPYSETSTRVEPDDRVRYTVTPKKGLAVGTYTDTITFLTTEKLKAEFKATVVVVKKADNLTVEPATLDFGIVEEGYAAVAPKTVTLKNNADYGMRLDQPYSYSYEISLLPQATLSSGGSTSFTIRPRTGLPQGAYSGVVEIMANGDSAKLNVQFTVTAKAGPSSYPDVASGSTFASDIAYVSQKGLMSGKADGNFKPQDAITRGQLVTILYRLEGQPAVSGAGFSDVAAGSYCEKAVKWASANRITNGNEDGTFKPDDPINRQQLATFLYRYNNYKGYMVAKQADLSTFSDGASVASYAKDALSWANGVGLVNGTSDGRLNPSGGATRGQAAAILHRFCASIGK